MSALEAVLLTIITASTPLLLAAVGELVTERSGVSQPWGRGYDDHGRGNRLRRRVHHRFGRRRRGGRHRHRHRHGAPVRLSDPDAGRQPDGHGARPDAVRNRALRPHRQAVHRPPGSQARSSAHSGAERPAAGGSGAVRPGRAGVRLHRHHRVGGLGLRPDPPRAGDPRRRHQSPFGPRPGLRRGRRALRLHRLRRSMRRVGGRLPVPRVYAAVDREHDRRPRLDRPGAGGVRHLGPEPGWPWGRTCSARCGSWDSTPRASG